MVFRIENGGNGGLVLLKTLCVQSFSFQSYSLVKGPEKTVFHTLQYISKQVGQMTPLCTSYTIGIIGRGYMCRCPVENHGNLSIKINQIYFINCNQFQDQYSQVPLQNKRTWTKFLPISGYLRKLSPVKIYTLVEIYLDF